MDGFKRRTEQKKDSIRRAAMELFQVHGFKKVSIGDIAEKAGVSHVTIYNHFGSKEDLVRDIIKTLIKDIMNTSREIIESDRPYLEKINLLIFSKSSLAGQYQGELLKTVARDFPDIQRLLEELSYEEIEKLLQKLIIEGKKLKYIKADLSPESIRYYFTILRKGMYADKDFWENMKINTKLAHDLNYLWLFGLIEKQD